MSDPQYHYRVTATRYSFIRPEPTPMTDTFNTMWEAREKAMYHILNTPARPDEGEVMNIQIVKEQAQS